MTRIRRLLLAFCLLLCLNAGAQENYGVSDSVARMRAMEYYYLQARSFLEQDSVDRCFEILEHCHAIDSGSLTVMYDLSSFYAYMNKDSIAHDMLDRIVKADPSNLYYNKALVSYYLRVGNLDAAIKVYENLLDKVHSKSEIYMYLASLYSDTGEHAKAIEALDRLEKLEGANEEITVEKIRHYMALGDSAKAVDVALGVINENPEDMRYQTLLGTTYSALGDNDKALEVFQKVLEAKPDDVYALSSLAGLYAGYSDDSLYCDAIERLLMSESLDTESRIGALLKYIEYKQPTDTTRVLNLMHRMSELPFDELEIADVYSRYLMFIEASPEKVIPVLEKVLSLEPENVTAILALLNYAINRNDIEAVFKYADNAQPYLSDKLDICYYKGLSLYLLGRKNESVEAYKEGLEKRAADTDPELVSAIYALLGDTYHDLGALDACMQAYDSALVYDDANIGVLNNYAYYLALEGKELDRALEMSYKTIVKEPDNPTYLDTYAWVLFKLGRYEEAKAYVEKLVASDEESSPEVYHHGGDIFAKCGDMDRAVEFWIKARDAGDGSSVLEKKIKKRKYYKDAKNRK